MALAFYDRVQMTVTGAPALGTITLSAATTGYRAVPAAADGKTVTYLVVDGSAWEVRKGVYTHAGTTLTRGTLEASSTGAAISLTAAAVVSIDFSAADAQKTVVTIPCQTRLSLVTGVSVLTSDQVAKTTLFKTPYVGKYSPIFDGSDFVMREITADISIILDTTHHLSTNVYDAFSYWDGSAVQGGVGPAWSTQVLRGTGAGTTEIEFLGGIPVNKNSITLWNNGASVVVAARQALFEGTFYCTANGQTGMAFKPAAASGGANNILGLWNAHNRLQVYARSLDSAGDYTYATSTWRSARASDSNRISWVDGLQRSAVKATYFAVAFTTTTSSVYQSGINFDSNTANPNNESQITGTGHVRAVADDTTSPLLGFHFAQAMERASATATVQNSGSAPHTRVEMELMM